jgi:hypothetical protein
MEMQQAIMRVAEAVQQLQDWDAQQPSSGMPSVISEGLLHTLDRALSDLRQLAAPTRSDKRRRRSKHRRSPPKKPRPLTEKQTEAMQLVGEHKGDITAAARAAGKSRQAMAKLYQKACAKLGQSVREKAPQTRRLPTDRRGQITL